MAEHAKELVRDGKYSLALEQLSTVQSAVKEQFHHWLNSELGHVIEVRNEKELDVLRYPFYDSIRSLDPLKTISRHDAHIVDHVYDTLLRYDDESKRLLPHVAHHWEHDQQKKTWTFYLRKGVKFHHGRELNAHDVAFTIRRLVQNEKRIPAFKLVKDIRVLRPTVIQFELEESNTLFPHLFCHHPTSIVPEEVWSKNPDSFARLPVGTGPFRVVQHDQTMMILEAFEHYFQGRVYLDRVEILTLPQLFPREEHPIHYSFNFSSKGSAAKWRTIKQVNPITALIQLFQSPHLFIYPLVGATYRSRIDALLAQVVKEADDQQQLRMLLALIEELKEQYVLGFIDHTSYSVNVNVGSALQGAALNDCGRVSYKQLWFKQ